MKTKSHFNLRLLCLAGVSLAMTTEALAQARLVLNGDVVVNLHGGSSTTPINMVVDNSETNAISASGGGRINSEGQFNVLRWNVENGTGNYIVPFADNAGSALPISVNVTAAGGSHGSILFSMYGTGPDNLLLPEGVTSIAHANDPNNLIPEDGAKLYDRYWFVEAAWLVEEAGLSTSPVALVSFSYATAAMSGDLTAGETIMAAQSYNGTSWDVSQTGSDDLSGNVTGIPLTGGTWALVESGAPLPITLLTFNAVWANERQSAALVNWSTASEQDNDFFVVERSADGQNWQAIGQVEGAGNSIHTNNYQFTDEQPLTGISYYRLRQVDFDGTATYTHIVSLKREINGAAIAVYPNPAGDQFQIAFEGFKSEEANINILDNSGRIVLAVSNNVINNPVQIINASGFQSGVYYIHVTSETESFIQKIVIKN